MGMSVVYKDSLSRATDWDVLRSSAVCKKYPARGALSFLKAGEAIESMSLCLSSCRAKLTCSQAVMATLALRGGKCANCVTVVEAGAIWAIATLHDCP